MDNPFAKYAKPEEENPFLRYAPSQEEEKEEENPFLKYSAPVEETPVAKGKPVSTTPEPSPDEPISVGQYASDYGKLFGAPAIQGVADLPQGLLDAAISVPRAFATGEAYERGPLIPRVLDKSVQLVRSLFGTSLTKQQEERLAGKIATDEFITEAKSLFELPRFFEYLSEEGGDVADKLRKSVSSRTRQKLEGSTPKGNFLEAAKTGDFSKLSFGDDPTLEGYAAHTVQVLGSLAPVIATAVITKGAPTPSAVVGGGMAGGEGAGEAREYVKSLSDGQLMEMSPYYANMRTAGIDEFIGAQGRATLLTLIAIGIVEAALRAGAYDVAIGQKLAKSFVIELLCSLCGKGALIVQSGEEFLCGGVVALQPVAELAGRSEKYRIIVGSAHEAL